MIGGIVLQDGVHFVGSKLEWSVVAVVIVGVGVGVFILSSELERVRFANN